MTEYGAPLTGAQMKLLRDAGFPDDMGFWSMGLECEITIPTCGFWSDGYRLPAGHPAYTLLEKGWLDGRNVALWFGGVKAPDDWDGGACLLRNGDDEGYAYKDCLSWRDDGSEYDIIAYIRKAEHREETIKACRSFDDTITLNKMTEEEWAQRFGLGDSDVAAKLVLDQLGLIKPEPTLEERFREKFPAYVKSSYWLKGWVKLALEFERD